MCDKNPCKRKANVSFHSAIFAFEKNADLMIDCFFQNIVCNLHFVNETHPCHPQQNQTFTRALITIPMRFSCKAILAKGNDIVVFTYPVSIHLKMMSFEDCVFSNCHYLMYERKTTSIHWLSKMFITKFQRCFCYMPFYVLKPTKKSIWQKVFCVTG